MTHPEPTRRPPTPAADARPGAGPTGPVIGIDIGGSKVSAALVDECGGLTGLQTVPVPTRHPDEAPRTQQDKGNQHLRGRERTATDDIGSIDDVLLDQIARLAGLATPVAIGVGAAGWIDADQVIRFSPHLPWREDDLARRLAARTRWPLRLVNDAKAAAWAEHRFGAGRDADSSDTRDPDAADPHTSTMLMVTLGTGIGGAMIRDGELLLGRNRMAGEFGHMVVVPDGRPCQCGNRGCWEQYASGNALVDLARDHGVGGEQAGPATTAAARAGDAAAIELLTEVGRWLGLGLANLTAALDPDRIVIGGGLGEAGELLLGPARAELAATLPGRGHRREPELVTGRLGNRAGLIGAAELARCAVAAAGSTTLGG